MVVSADFVFRARLLRLEFVFACLTFRRGLAFWVLLSGCEVLVASAAGGSLGTDFVFLGTDQCLETNMGTLSHSAQVISRSIEELSALIRIFSDRGSAVYTARNE